MCVISCAYEWLYGKKDNIYSHDIPFVGAAGSCANAIPASVRYCRERCAVTEWGKEGFSGNCWR